MSVIFDKPQWPLRSAREGLEVAGLSNTVRVVVSTGRTFEVNVDVPTDFYKLAREVFGVDTFTDEDYLYLEESEDGKRWYFGFQRRHDNDSWDLWYYTASTAPEWVWNQDPVMK